MSKTDCSQERVFINKLEENLFTRFGMCYTIKEKEEMAVQLSGASRWLDSDYYWKNNTLLNIEMLNVFGLL